MEIKVGDLVLHQHNGYGTVLKVKDGKCAVYWHNPANPAENNEYLNPFYYVRYIRQWKRNVEDICSVSSTG